MAISEANPLNKAKRIHKPMYLTLDKQTLSDLEVFSSPKGGMSLFDFCNYTVTKGGENILRQRMEKPWSTPELILNTQKSIAFILKNMDVFNGIPSNFVVVSVESHIHGILPIVEHDSFIEFTLGAYSLWATEDRHYFSIVKGVQMICKFLNKASLFFNNPQLDRTKGELAPLIEEGRTILINPVIAKCPSDISSLGMLKVWRTLKLDRHFRINHVSEISRLLEIIYQIDALVSLAKTTSINKFKFPHIESGRLFVSAKGLIHPFLKNAIANPVDLNYEKRGIFLTGPNMAGKTTYLRAFAISIYFSHLGMGVAAEEYHFTPIENIISSITLSDNLHEGVSYFRAEAIRVKEISQIIVERKKVIAILDEPFKGTNVKDTYEASQAILEKFSNWDNCLFMFSSHQLELGDDLQKKGYPIDCKYFEAIETGDKLGFDFALKTGVSRQRIGMRVLYEEGVFDLFNKS